MIVALTGAEVFAPERLGRVDLLSLGGRIDRVGELDLGALERLGVGCEVLDCAGALVIPGFVDPHVHLIGGSGEKGFASRTPEIFFSEIVGFGTTTVVGTLGVDTTSRAMPDLLAKVKALRETGLSAYCYAGGYDLPPKSLLASVREDIMYFDEIIGAGEVAISDKRAHEPDIAVLARVTTDAYVGGKLSGKAGVLHVHVGSGRKRLQPLRRLLDEFEIAPETIYASHIERDRELVAEGVDLAKRGCFVDFDVVDKDFHQAWTWYRELGGPADRLSASSDASITSTGSLLDQLRECVLEHGHALEEVLPHFTTNAARALKLHAKGRVAVGADADLTVLDAKTLEVRHVLARGQICVRDGRLTKRESFFDRFERKVSLHGSQES